MPRTAPSAAGGPARTANSYIHDLQVSRTFDVDLAVLLGVEVVAGRVVVCPVPLDHVLAGDEPAAGHPDLHAVDQDGSALADVLHGDLRGGDVALTLQ